MRLVFAVSTKPRRNTRAAKSDTMILSLAGAAVVWVGHTSVSGEHAAPPVKPSGGAATGVRALAASSAVLVPA